MSSGSSSPTTALSLDDDPPDRAREQQPPDPVLPKLGHLLTGKYRVDGMLGRGGMGVVAAGHQLSLDRPVAIKFLRHALVGTARQRFTREAMAIARMRSEHVVRVFDAGEEDGVPFIVMERLVGNDLAAELRQGPLDAELAVAYLREACEAIAEAHSLGIVHRDIKPSNLFIAAGPNGRRMLKVLDFGVSKWLGAAPDGETPLSTSDQGLVGTPAYVSPEQLTAPAGVDERTDVWSLGVVLYQALSGKRPFEARGVPQLCAAILTAPPPEFDPNLGVPNELRLIVERCMQKKPADRYGSVDELARALASFTLSPTVAERMLRSVRARPGLSVLVVVCVLGALALVAAGLREGRESEERPLAKTQRSESPVTDTDLPRGLSDERPAFDAQAKLPVAATKLAPAALPSAPKAPARPFPEARRSSVPPVPGSARPSAPAGSGEPAIEKPRPSDAESTQLYRR